GKRVFETTSCINCHAVSGTPANGRFGPDLAHLMSRKTIASGAAENTTANLRLWIQNPDAIKPGSLMPALKLSDADLDAVTAHLETLRSRAIWRPVMSTNATAIENLQSSEQPWTDIVHEWVTTVDHKRIGILYILYGLVYLVFAGLEALIIRVQLMHAHNNFVSPQVFNRMFTMHGTTMIFFVVMPVLFGFANYLVPLMIGARDMAFPRLNAFSFWLTALGGLLLYFSFLGGSGLYGAGNAPDIGWWAYAPLALKAFSPGHSSDYWTIALIVSGFGSVGAGINLIATVLCMRCPGMHLGRMPLMVWLNFVMSAMLLLAITPLTAAQLMLLVDRYLGGHFFDTQAGGDAVLWMHFFWIFGHPEVYVLVLPAFGVISEIVPVFSRKSML